MDSEFRRQRSNELSEKIIGCAIRVHSALGRGLLESAYEECLCFELTEAKIEFERQMALPLDYGGIELEWENG